MAMTASEVLTLSVFQEARSADLRSALDSESSFLRQMRRDHPDLFPNLLSTGRYHRRWKVLVGVQQTIYTRLASESAHVAR